MLRYLGDESHDRPRQSGVTTLIQRNSQVNDLDDFFNPDGDLFKDMSELDLLTILVAINCPTFFDTCFLFALCDFLDLVMKDISAG